MIILERIEQNENDNTYQATMGGRWCDIAMWWRTCRLYVALSVQFSRQVSDEIDFSILQKMSILILSRRGQKKVFYCLTFVHILSGSF